MDNERVFKKIGYIREQVASIRELLLNREKDDILNNPWLVRGLKYALQTAIEAVIDIAYHISAKKYFRAPRDARQAMQILAENGVISQERMAVYSSMIGLRNRIVHGYQDVSGERLYEILINHLDDLERFVCEIKLLL
ncbi:MAG: type VII toxin-antitoxin system HepT family RNase toxin [Desulfurispora sp.]|uniref:type VII toxin-antitoxin system HepT family RNase toxin n=1 Tax=Desulfurispora sp. TaxID=3014275 RepID=UPI00404B4C8B